MRLTGPNASLESVSPSQPYDRGSEEVPSEFVRSIVDADCLKSVACLQGDFGACWLFRSVPADTTHVSKPLTCCRLSSYVILSDAFYVDIICKGNVMHSVAQYCPYTSGGDRP